jgi:hypothetical protein
VLSTLPVTSNLPSKLTATATAASPCTHPNRCDNGHDAEYMRRPMGGERCLESAGRDRGQLQRDPGRR